MGWAAERRIPCCAVASPDAVDVRRLRWAALVAGVGDGVVAVALPLLAAGLTRDPLAVAGVFVAQHLPWAFLPLAMPALRSTDRRTLAGAGDSMRAVAVAIAGLLAVIGDETILTIQLVAFVVGLAQALSDDAERVGGETREAGPGSSAQARLAGAGMVGLAVLGLPLGGALYELLAPIPLLFDIGVFAVAALLVLAVQRPLLDETTSEEDEARRPWPRLAEGTRLTTSAAAAAAGGAGAITGVLVLIALDELGLGAPAFGFLLAGLAASSLVGALAAPRVGAFLGLRAATALGLAVAAAGQTTAWALLDPERPYPSVVALGVAGAAGMLAAVLLRARRHGTAGTRGAEARRAFHLAVWAATPVGALLGGVVARDLGPGDVLLLGAGASLLAAALAGMTRVRSTADVPADVP